MDEREKIVKLVWKSEMVRTTLPLVEDRRRWQVQAVAAAKEEEAKERKVKEERIIKARAIGTTSLKRTTL